MYRSGRWASHEQLPSPHMQERSLGSSMSRASGTGSGILPFSAHHDSNTASRPSPSRPPTGTSHDLQPGMRDASSRRGSAPKMSPVLISGTHTRPAAAPAATIVNTSSSMAEKLVLPLAILIILVPSLIGICIAADWGLNNPWIRITTEMPKSWSFIINITIADNPVRWAALASAILLALSIAVYGYAVYYHMSKANTRAGIAQRPQGMASTVKWVVRKHFVGVQCRSCVCILAGLAVSLAISVTLIAFAVKCIISVPMGYSGIGHAKAIVATSAVTIALVLALAIAVIAALIHERIMETPPPSTTEVDQINQASAATPPVEAISHIRAMPYNHNQQPRDPGLRGNSDPQPQRSCESLVLTDSNARNYVASPNTNLNRSSPLSYGAV